MGFKILQNKNHALFQREITTKKKAKTLTKFPETQGQFQPNLIQRILGLSLNKIQVRSNVGSAFSQGETMLK